jgi:hypothetical protein
VINDQAGVRQSLDLMASCVSARIARCRITIRGARNAQSICRMPPNVPSLETDCVNVHGRLIVIDGLLQVTLRQISTKDIAIDANGGSRVQRALA